MGVYVYKAFVPLFSVLCCVYRPHQMWIIDVHYLLLSKFRTVSVVNCVLYLIVGFLKGLTFSQLAVEYKWMVQEAGSKIRWA